MSTNTKKRVPIALILVLAIVLVSVLGFTLSAGVTYAADEQTITYLDEISVGHLSDIHYFPLEYCYQDVYSPQYLISDFYHSTTGDTKLVVESGIALNATIQNIIADGRNGEAPTYLVASGDLSKNGERVALIDVANSLRYLQNAMRSLGGKYANFQVFATVGNHDLYNHDGALYSQENGDSRPADMVTAMQFAMIFAGLGFPNANVTDVDGMFNLTEYFPAEYWSSEYTGGYVASANAENLRISYYSDALTEVTQKSTSVEKLESYLKIGDELNQLTYFAELTDKTGFSFAIIDSADREETDAGALVRISRQEYDSLTDKPAKLYLDTGNDNVEIDFAHPITNAGEAFSQSDKNVYRRTPVQHITGGRITEACLNWVQTKADASNVSSEETIISSFHHNVLPHFEQEDDILKDFTLYNWEYTANRMLDMGIRYALTGHMHASDAMSYTDIEGRTLYDFETGSVISYASPRRYLTFKRNDCDGKLGEQVISEVHVLDNIKEVASNNITNAPAWDDAAYKAAIAKYNELEATNPTEEQRAAEWQKVVATNPDYLTYIIRYDEFQEFATYNDFISKDIYAIIVDRMVDHFINQSTIDGLLETVDGVIAGLDNSSSTMVNTVLAMLGVNGRTLQLAADYILDTVLNHLYGESGYPYNGKTYDTALDYVLAIVNDVLDLKFGDDSIVSDTNPKNKGKLTVRELASFIMMSHSAGSEISLTETYATIDAKFTDTPYVGESEEAQRRYKQPTDRTYRKRMLAAIKDFDNQLKIAEGGVVDTLLSSILDPLFNNDDSLLKTLLNYKFDFSKVKWDESENATEQVWDEELMMNVTRKYNKQYRSIQELLEVKLNDIGGLLAVLAPTLNVEIPDDFSMSFDATSVSISEILNSILPIAKPLVDDLLGFNMVGNSIVDIVTNLLDDYITPSFLIGLGGIAGDIVMAFATDVYPDVKDMRFPGNPFDIQPYGDYKYAEQNLAYLSTNNVVSTVGAEFNAATQINGRVPSRVTANFDTKDSTTAFTVKFYTAEDVYGTFKYKTAENGEWISLSTSKANADTATDYLDSKASATANGIKVDMLTQTKPVYLPLIDLGLLCLTHAEVDYETTVDGKKVELPYKYGERDNAPKNSVVYWNVTTVTVSGLSAGTTYYYDIEGSYVNGNTSASFSFAEYNKTLGYDKDYFTFTTAKDASADKFEFLTIADIQGMIQGMYSDSFEAVKALLADDRTKNFDFILNAGDMCDNGKNFNQWGMALNTYQTLFANSSMFFAAGNHESGSNALANYFNYTLPLTAQSQDVVDGMYFSFNYGNAHFIVLNTNDANASGLGAKQLTWLKNDLSANKNAKWKFVLMHKSIFSGGSHSTDSEVVAMRNQLVPLFADNGVNIVFGGHDHTYTSTHLLDANGNVQQSSSGGSAQYTGEGVLYITLGTMGTKFYNYKDNPVVSEKFDDDKSILETLTTQTFGKVVVDGDTITFTSYKYDKENNSLTVIGDTPLTSVAPPSPNKGLTTGALVAIIVVVVIVVLAIVAVIVILVVKKKQEEKRKAEALRKKKIAILKARKAAEAKAKAEAEAAGAATEQPSDNDPSDEG